MGRVEARAGFTLIELLIVVAVIGILAAIAIPNLLVAMNRAKQKRTIADIKNLANAWESRQVDMGAYSSAGATFTWPDTTYSGAAMIGLLAPTYMRTVPTTDGWTRPLDYATDGRGSQDYGIRSAGKDGIFSGSTYPQGPTVKFDCDIVYSNGAFVAWPEGVPTD